jgi:hypothetical protein
MLFQTTAMHGVAQIKIVVLMVQEVTTRSVRVQTISIFERDQYILMQSLETRSTQGARAS